MMGGILGFLVAIIILVSVHEYGHYIVARWFGVKVLRFSIGFGKPFLSRYDKNGTEFCIAPIPLGGYVKFLDTREIESLEELNRLTSEEKAVAFDLQNVWKRIAIVFAGPCINFLLAWLLFSVVSYGEKTVIMPVLGPVNNESVVYQAGLREGDQIMQINEQKVDAWNHVYMILLKTAMKQSSVKVSFMNSQGEQIHTTLALDKDMVSDQFSWRKYGLQPWQPEILPVVEKLSQKYGVKNASLKEKDRILSINQIAINNWQELVNEVREKPNEEVQLGVLRDGVNQQIGLKLGSRIVDGQVIGFLGVQVALPSEEAWASVTKKINNGIFDALWQGANQTYNVVNLIATSVVGMVTGGVSLDNIGGPITIAKKAGESAQIGFFAFIVFIAFLSVSLGGLNLLPIPMLDGGHIVLYFWEAITGKMPSVQWQLVFQRIGLSIVIALTVIALLNDIFRL